jgi:hypothetical protein
MVATLTNIGEYIAIGFVLILAFYGIFMQVRIWYRKSKTDEDSSKYAEFMTTISALKDKINLMQSDMEALDKKVKHLEDANKSLLEDVGKYNDKANHYLALFMTRCPYEELKAGKGYCDYFHPLDKKRIREGIMSRIALEADDVEELEDSFVAKDAKDGVE